MAIRACKVVNWFLPGCLLGLSPDAGLAGFVKFHVNLVGVATYGAILNVFLTDARRAV